MRPERTQQRGKFHRLRTRKTERLRYEKINSDPYAKWTARRVASAPARQGNPVGRASCTPQARACRHLEYVYLAVPRAYSAHAGQRFCRAHCPNRRATLESFTGPIAMDHQIHTYAELRQQVHDDLRIQHPEWIKSNGECPMCDSYESRLTELLDPLLRRGSIESVVATHRASEAVN
jgi:hypothetical protein